MKDVAEVVNISIVNRLRKSKIVGLKRETSTEFGSDVSALLACCVGYILNYESNRG